MKKRFKISLTVFFMLLLFAASIIAYQNICVWKIETCTFVGDTTNGLEKGLIGSYTAKAAGERYFASVNPEYSGSISGNLKVKIRAVEEAVGGSLTGSREFLNSAASATSAELKAGETVRAWAQPSFIKYEIVQKKYYLLPGGAQREADISETIYAYKPILPMISFAYDQ